MEFPRHLHKPDGLYVVCADEEQLSELSQRGWELLPAAHVEKPIQVSLFDALAEPIKAKLIDFNEDEPAEKPKGKPGRKPKSDAVN